MSKKNQKIQEEVEFEETHKTSHGKKQCKNCETKKGKIGKDNLCADCRKELGIGEK